MSVDGAIDLFTESFGVRPQVVASAPGRVNLIGEHIDYNGGQVLPMAIAQRTWVAMGSSRRSMSQAVSASAGGMAEFDAGSPQRSGQWWDYLHGTLRELRGAGRPTSVQVAVTSEVPQGSGLSSSAALEVATALAGLVVWNGEAESAREQLATIAHRAETEFVGVACGVMDQTVSAFAREGHALRLWCDSGKREHVPFHRAVLIVDTATPRALRHSRYNERRAECDVALHELQRSDATLRHLAHATPQAVQQATLSDEVRRRAAHVVGETRRVGEFVDLAMRGESVGAVMLASHRSLRDDYECSSPELDWVVEHAMQLDGIEGARMTGAGWGGCAIVVGRESALRELSQSIVPEFAREWRRAPSTWMSTAATGARIDWVPTA